MIISSQILNKLSDVEDRLSDGISDSNQTLLSLVEISKDDLNIVTENIDNIINLYLRHGEFRLLTAYCLMLHSMKSYEEGAYWDSFWSSIKKQRNPNYESELGHLFQEVCSDYNLTYTRNYYKKNIINFSMHALIPDAYSKIFYDKVEKFYRLVLRSNLESLSNKDIYELLNCFGSSIEGHQFFMPIEGMRAAFLRPDCCEDFILNLLKRIDGSETSDTCNLGIHETTFQAWSHGIDHTNKSVRPHFKFNIRSDDIILFVPERTIDLSDDSDIELYSADRMVTKIPTYPYRIGNKQITNEKSIKLDSFDIDLFNGVKVRIADKTVFDFSDRDHIIFSSKGIQTHTIFRGMNYVLVKPDLEIFCNTKEILFKRSDFTIYRIDVSGGETVVISDKEYNIEKPIDDIISFSDDYSKLICESDDGVSLDTYFKLPKIFIRSSKRKFSQRTIEITTIQYRWKTKLSELKRSDAISISEFDDEVLVSIDLSKVGIVNKQAIYSIQVDNRKKINFALLPDIMCVSDQERYHINSKDCKLSLFIGRAIEIPFFPTERFVDLTEYIDIPGYKVKFVVPAYYFSLDGNNWSIFGSYVNLDDISDCIFINGPAVEAFRYSIKYKGSRMCTSQFDEKIGYYIESKTLARNLKYLPNAPPMVKLRMNSFDLVSHSWKERTIMRIGIHDFNISPTFVKISNPNYTGIAKVMVSDTSEVFDISLTEPVLMDFSSDRTITIINYELDEFSDLEEKSRISRRYTLELLDPDSLFNEYCSVISYTYDPFLNPINIKKDVFYSAFNPFDNDADVFGDFTGFCNIYVDDPYLNRPLFFELWRRIFRLIRKKKGYSIKEIVVAIHSLSIKDPIRSYLLCSEIKNESDDSSLDYLMKKFEKDILSCGLDDVFKLSSVNKGD